MWDSVVKLSFPIPFNVYPEDYEPELPEDYEDYDE